MGMCCGLLSRARSAGLVLVGFSGPLLAVDDSSYMAHIAAGKLSSAVATPTSSSSDSGEQQVNAYIRTISSVTSQ